MFRKRFVFGKESTGEGTIGVSPADLYRPEKGYGFVTEANRREQELLRFPELNAGFEPVYWYGDQELSQVEAGEGACFLDSDGEVVRLQQEAGEHWRGERRQIPLSFKADVPGQGNYKVTVEIPAGESGEGAGRVLLFTGRRRLGYMGDLSVCSAGTGGSVFSYTMTVNVCDIVPRGQTKVYEDKSLDITLVADRPQIHAISIEETQCPTLYIAGDSTVTDQSAEYPYAPGTSYSGWGQMITAYLKEGIAVSNHAHSGLTTDSFRREGHLQVVNQYGKSGDYVLFQFGHNDQKLEELKAREGYRENLLRYIRECREKRMYPLLVTPLARNTWKGNDGTYNDLLAEYAASCMEVGADTGTPVLDLHGRSMAFILEKGLEEAKPYFFPGDYTHSNDYGAYHMAGLVAEEIGKVCTSHPDPAYRFLATCVTEGFGAWEPAGEVIPLSRPEKFKDVADPAEGAKLLAETDRLDEPVDRACALDMVIKTARFFPTNVYNDMYTDVVGHEWYAGAVECACQNGLIDPGMVEDDHFYPERPVTLEEFLVFAVNGYKSRKKLPGLGACAYDGLCRAYARPYIQAACRLGLLAPDGSQDLGKILTRREAVELCRRLGI